MDRETIEAIKKTEDIEFEENIRPRKLKEFIGQEKIKEKLSLFIEAALQRKEPMDHTLLYGPPGLGKTTLAHIIAYEMGSDIRITSGPAIERAGDLAAILTNLEEKEVLFIDEIHRLNKQVEEILYSAMEDFKLDIVLGKGPSARTIRLDIPRFTLVGATTRTGLVNAPLLSRFGIVERLDFYTPEELKEIILRSARILKVEIEDDAAFEIAKRSRGTPRIANRLLRRVRDFAQIKGNGTITLNVARDSLELLEIDELGLTKIDREILETIVDKFGGGPVGLGTLAASISEEVDTISEVYEPYLLQIGLIGRTPRGRIATPLTYKHLGKKKFGFFAEGER